MSVRWRFKWGLLFWHAVSIASFSIRVPAAQKCPYHLAPLCATKDLFHRASHEFDYALKQAGFFNACCIFLSLGFGTARKVSGVLNSGSDLSPLTCCDYDGLLCIWFLDQQPLTLESLVSLAQPSTAQLSILSSSSSSGAFHCCICSHLLL